MSPTGPKLGTFCTASNRVWSCDDDDDVLTTEVFSTAFSSAPSMLTVLNFIDIMPLQTLVHRTIGIKASTEEVRGDQFTLRIGVWGDGRMSDNGCNWLAVSPGDTRFRSGTYRINRRSLALSGGQGYATSATLPVVYDAPFPPGTQPTVVVWLSGFQMAANDLWHLGVAADAVSATGFSLKVSAPHAWLYQASIAWFAYVPGAARSGRFQETGVNAEQGDYGTSLRKKGEVLFETPFEGVPVVMQGVCSVEMAESPCVTVQVYDPTEVTAEGFRWKVGTWGQTVCDKVGVAYVALDNP